MLSAACRNHLHAHNDKINLCQLLALFPNQSNDFWHVLNWDPDNSSLSVAMYLRQDLALLWPVYILVAQGRNKPLFFLRPYSGVLLPCLIDVRHQCVLPFLLQPCNLPIETNWYSNDAAQYF